MEESMEYNSNLYLMFIDSDKAFDSMWIIMKKYGIPKHVIDLVKQSYDGDTCHMVHDGRLSEPIPTTAGVKQGCISKFKIKPV
jgi:glutathionylspermidine synthase